MRKPIIPMSPEQLPQQRIVPVADLAERPDPFDAVVGWDEKPAGVELPNGPRNADYLGQVEWTWSPMHSRIDAYYISRGRTHWLLWIYSYDDDDGWTWLAIGHAPRSQASRMQAAIHLMADFWRMEKHKAELDHYHWINEHGDLGASEWRTIALLVWPEVAAKRIAKADEDNDN